MEYITQFLDIVTVVSAILGALVALGGVLVSHRVLKGKEFKRVVDLLDKGQTMLEALSQVRISKKDVERHTMKTVLSKIIE